MRMSNRGRLLVLSGPSGTGKSTVVRGLVQHSDRLRLSVSATTRSPRGYETEGVDYFFLAAEEFRRRIVDGEMLEYASYNGNYYGTPQDAVDAWLDEGYDVLLEIEVQGALQVKERRPDAILVFLVPPSMKEAEARLRGRGSEDDATVRARLAIAAGEIRQAIHYDYIVVNHTVEQAVEDIDAVLRAAHLSAEAMEGHLENLLAECPL
ncbi:MAG: guanylate kinase [Clostridia bacterium]|nr:guanylate kinase [Clostridia bacterium]